MSQHSLFPSPPPGPPADRLVRVVVERGIEERRHAGADRAVEGLTYRDSLGGLSVGERVLVPLGRGDAQAGGIVVAVGGPEILAGFDPRKVKAVLGRSGGRILPELVELARWMAQYYVCPLGMALATLMPAAVKRGTGERTRTLLQRAGDAPARLEALGAELRPPLRTAWEKITALDPSLFPIDAVELAAEGGFRTRREVNALVKAGLLEEVQRKVVDRGAAGRAWRHGEIGPSAAVAPTLTGEQRVVVEGVGATLGRFGVHLLHGVTGSGKTEVYLRLIERIVAGGRSAIVLVPEIALTPQTSGRFLARFRDTGVAVLHSGLTAAERNREWTRAAEGRVRIVVGARSAVFAPLANLGLVVVDEEHDHSYKQDQLPRYHARDVAIMRARGAGCPVLMGSATPSLESWSNALPAATGGAAKYALWRLTQRATGGSLPRVRIVDLMSERRQRQASGDRTQRLLGPMLEGAIDAALRAGGQCILLLNRRGFGQYISCTDPACGFVLHCDQCSASLVYHKERALPLGGVLKCHHCLCEQIVPRLCALCSGKLRTFGGGTQRAEEELERCFASHDIVSGRTLLRVDSDTMRSARDYFEALSRFSRGEVRILLGTQMIAKGLDFPNVRLVGVIDADTAASVPDFRASERTFQLISQVAGRAGRAEHAGLVLVQTVDPLNRAIVLASRHDFPTFAGEELEARRRFNLPPGVRMARIVCRDEDAARARAAARALADELARAAGDALAIQPPAECPLARIAGHFRFEVVVTARSAGQLQHALAALRSRGLLKSDARTAVDVDPVSMM